MEELYLVTGATGFLGHYIVENLKKRGKEVVALRMPGDKAHLSEGISYELGNITKPYTLQKFFERAKDRKSILIHCAGMVSIATSGSDLLWKVNVDGTRNIVDLCERYEIGRLVYVSSVHAIPEQEGGQVIKEPEQCSASLVEGAYGKSKAEAAVYVKKAAERGLDAVIAYPSGMIGPEDYTKGYMTEVIRAYLKGYFPAAVQGGYDFADVRDVAEGVVACAEKGRQGEGYILSGEYVTVKEMFEKLSRIAGKKTVRHEIPLWAVRWAAPACEKLCRRMQRLMLITPYSLYTLGSNGNFSCEKAVEELGYCHRPIEETLADTAMWLNKN